MNIGLGQRPTPATLENYKKMALLQIQEPTKAKEENSNEIIVGIDLGTTNSLIAIIEDEKVKFFSDKNGNSIHPSVIAYDEDGKLISIGNDAVKSLTKNKISSIKRLMGKSLSDLKNISHLPFQIDQKTSEKEALKIIVGNRKIRPAEISSEILKYLKNLAEKNLNQTIKKAVITVPAYFDEAAKNATKLAANLADLEVIRLVNEPTAAALAYGLENSSEGIYAVYDLGGGTFDVSILSMQKGVFKVLGVAGDNSLGGDDFDAAILEKFPNLNLEKARKIKEELSTKDEVTIENGSKISRTEFENLISKYSNKTFSLTQNLIEDLELEDEQIKGVILVGGSTRIPVIKQKLSEIFGAAKVFTNLDPDHVVAIGAAHQAYNLSGQASKKNLLLDVCPLSLGIEMMGGLVDKIIPRNSTIPTAMAKEFTTYADNQTGMKLHIVQGERELASDCRSLAEFEIKNIPAMQAGMARILVTFKLDADGLLTVSAEEKITKTKQEIEVKPSYSLSENEVKTMLLDSMKNSAADMEKRLLIETIVESKHDIDIIQKDLEKSDSDLSEEEKTLIAEKLEILETEIKKQASREAVIKAHKDLEQAAEKLILKKVNTVLQSKIAGKKVNEF